MDTFEDKVKPYFATTAETTKVSGHSGSYPLFDPTSVPLSAQQYYLAQQWIKRENSGQTPAVPK